MRIGWVGKVVLSSAGPLLIGTGIFGAIMLPEGLLHLTGEIVVYALLSLTIVRMLPIAISLIGKRLMWQTVALFGWFGPRGIASIIYMLIVLNRAHLEDADRLLRVTVVTIGLSVLLHGASALPLTRWYHRLKDDMDETMAEMQPVTEMPTRR